jgi:hypothetical protein
MPTYLSKFGYVIKSIIALLTNPLFSERLSKEHVKWVAVITSTVCGWTTERNNMGETLDKY